MCLNRRSWKKRHDQEVQEALRKAEDVFQEDPASVVEEDETSAAEGAAASAQPKTFYEAAYDEADTGVDLGTFLTTFLSSSRARKYSTNMYN